MSEVSQHEDTFDGFGVEGIVGMDFLREVGAVIDLARLEICPATQQE